MEFEKYKRIHFIGIGGIGMSAIARFFNSRGVEVSGSDSTQSEITDALEKEGIPITIGNAEENVNENIDSVIYTLAIGEDDPEFLKAKKLKTPTYTYAEMLGQVSAGMRTIAVSGTHGKTTTTAMVNSALRGLGLDPNMIVGSLLSESQTNFIKGSSDIFITEVCEYKRSFLNLNPEILVITNIEEDHLDYYKDLDDIKDAFMELADKVPNHGKIICDFDDVNLKEIMEKYRDKTMNYREFVKQLPEMIVFGEHNYSNAAAALAVASLFPGDLAGAKKGLAEFRGTWRRLEYKGENKNGAILYNDYSHHPTAIAAALNSLRERFPDKKIIVFFKPHLYSRTKCFLNEFISVLGTADELFLLPIYAAREPHDPEISSQSITDKVPGSRVLNDFDEAKEEISKRTDGDLVVAVGAGDIYKVLD